jgi:oxygen-independent coproporphyrinogen-3 oxidase
MGEVSIYIHFPFCQHRCAYCDFNTYAGISELILPYSQALCREIGYLARSPEQRLPVHTVFFGGGTPSLLPVDSLDEVMNALQSNFHLATNTEITLEANPGTLSLEYLLRLKSAGVNRLSLGMQSALPEELRFLEREHDFLAVIESVQWARKAGFTNLNLDLIYGLPDQSLASWQCSLKMATNLNPEHISIYSLSLEHGTPLDRWTARGLINQPDPDMAADMYEWASEFLEARGYYQYEISNWARLDNKKHHLMKCLHNIQYWHLDPYIGFGAGAHGFIGGVRTVNVLSPAQYIKRLTTIEIEPPAEIFPRTPATAVVNPVERVQEMGEFMMMGLRLTQEGVSNTLFNHRFGSTIQNEYGNTVKSLVSSGLLEWEKDNQDTLRLTKRGHLLGNRVFREFI